MTRPAILVHLGGGMGDILLASAMLEMLGRAGHPVDVCVAGETRGTETLIDGLPFLRRVSCDPASFEGEEYGYYIYGDMILGGPIRFRNRETAIVLHPKWDWNQGHKLYSEVEMYTHLARAIAPDAPTVDTPSALAGDRVFSDIGPRTLVLVPGGQRTLILRAWPYFGQLARHFDDVAVVGTPSDLDLANRIIFTPRLRNALGGHLGYRGKVWRIARRFAERHDTPIEFPTHVKNYIGKLSLLETAALLRQAGLVVANDCGIAHLSVALRQKTLVLLGPTSRRRVYPEFWPHVHVIARDFECQPCQEKMASLGVWRESQTQCFCPFHLRCMNELSVERVAETARALLRPDVPDPA
jgi:hypothetical protein